MLTFGIRPPHVALLCVVQQSINISCRPGHSSEPCSCGPCCDRQTPDSSVSGSLTALCSLNYEIHDFSIVSATSYTVDNQQSTFYIQYHTRVVIVYAYCNVFCQVSSLTVQLTMCHVCLGHAMLLRPSYAMPGLSNVQVSRSLNCRSTALVCNFAACTPLCILCTQCQKCKQKMQ